MRWLHDWDWDDADRSAWAHWGYGFFLIPRRLDEAVPELTLARELDPLLPFMTVDLSAAQWFAGRDGEALSSIRQALAAHARAAAINPTWLTHLAVTHARLGNRAQARSILAEVERAGREDPFFLASVHAALGEPDAAFRLLEAAHRERTPGLDWLWRQPGLESLRDDPRFLDLARRMNLSNVLDR